MASGGARASNAALAVCLAAVAMGLLITLPWETKLEHSFIRDTNPTPDSGPQDTPEWSRSVEHFAAVDGTQLEAYLYLPKDGLSHPPPIVLMAHGMGAQKDIGLPAYAEQFARSGVATYMFDYRGFGGSDGEPRHWVSPRRHLQDWESAVKLIRQDGLGGRVDAGRLALWGVSYAGGHALVTASRLGASVSAVIANEPYLSGDKVTRHTARTNPKRSLRLLAAALSDVLRACLGMPPVYIRLIGPMSDHASLAVLPLQDSEFAASSLSKGAGSGAKGGSGAGDVSTGGRAAARRQGGWKNVVLARLVLEAVGYRPLDHLPQVKCPVFLRIALKDHLCPPEVARQAASRLGGPVQVQERNVTHIAAHASGALEGEIAPVVAFLRRHLGLERLSQAGKGEGLDAQGPLKPMEGAGEGAAAAAA